MLDGDCVFVILIVENCILRQKKYSVKRIVIFDRLHQRTHTTEIQRLPKNIF